MSANRHQGDRVPGQVPCEMGRALPRPARSRGPVWHALCALLLVWLPGVAAAEEVRWRHDYGKALKEANERGVPLFLNVGGENCFWCKQLDSRTFIDEELSKMINERCIPLKVNGDKNTYLVQALRVEKYPTLIFAAPDGSILGYKVGFVEAGELKEQMVKVLAAVGTPDWMQRDFDAAARAQEGKDFARAIGLLKTVAEDGKNRPVQVKARAILAEMEKQAGAKFTQGKELADRGKTPEAIAALEQVDKAYAGTQSAHRAKQLLLELNAKVARNLEERKRQAAELLKQAREDYDNRYFLACLDRCEDLSNRFPDLPEGATASKLAGEIKDNPEWTKAAADQLADRLCLLYLALADTWLKKGQPQQAIFYLERVVKTFPGTRHSELAQSKLTRLRGTPTVGVERKDNNP